MDEGAGVEESRSEKLIRRRDLIIGGTSLTLGYMFGNILPVLSGDNGSQDGSEQMYFSRGVWLAPHSLSCERSAEPSLYFASREKFDITCENSGEFVRSYLGSSKLTGPPQYVIWSEDVVDHLLGHKEVVDHFRRFNDSSLNPRFSIDWNSWQDHMFRVEYFEEVLGGSLCNVLSVKSPDNQRKVFYVDRGKNGVVNDIIYEGTNLEETFRNLDDFGDRKEQQYKTDEKNHILKIVSTLS